MRNARQQSPKTPESGGIEGKGPTASAGISETSLAAEASGADGAAHQSRQALAGASSWKNNSTALAIRSLAKIALPPTSINGLLCMLIAYFDDSGTHDASSALVMAGWVGDEEQWTKFDAEWRAILAREGITAFHMTECEAADGEFDMWPRPRRDAVIHDLRQVILNNGLRGVGAVIARKDWNRLVVGKVRDILGDGSDVCFVHAIDLAAKWARLRTAHHEMAFVFDIGMESEEKNLIVKMFDENYRDVPAIKSITFARVKQFTPLQAADMLAWESYQRALQLFSEGAGAPTRAHFQRFLDENSIYGEILDAEMIQREVDRRLKE